MASTRFDGCPAWPVTAGAGGRVGTVARMCLDRRSFLVGGVVAAAGATVAAGTRPPAAHGGAAQPPPAVEVAPGLTVLRRDAWGVDLPAPSGLPAEAPGDVRVLLVHHSASTNDYGEEAVVGQIREFHALHTGPEKGWPDVAYNFFVDRFGRVWEGRSGSLDAPVIGDATGGNQGFSQLVCMIGDFVDAEPTPEALTSLVATLAWLAARSGVDVTPGATTSFVSRGSNRWPAGATVETTTIAGHRDMSQTACPGDRAYAHVRGDLPGLVSGRVAEVAAATATTAPPPPTTTAPPSTTATSPPSSPSSGGSEAAAGRGGDDDGPPLVAVGGAAVAVAGATAALGLRLRNRRPPAP